jgi:hypothetical protein
MSIAACPPSDMVELGVQGVMVKFPSTNGLLKTKIDYREKDVLAKPVLTKLSHGV